MQRIFVTTGYGFTDIDGFSCVIAYTNLLRQEGSRAIAYLPSPVNHSVPDYVSEWNLDYSTSYAPDSDDKFVIMDVSDPSHFPREVIASRIIELYDHHFGFEKHWGERLGNNSKIEKVGACATLIVEEYERRNLTQISPQDANLLALAIVSNTLDFKSSITHKRDKEAFQYLIPFLTLEEDWIQKYFSSNDVYIYSNPSDSMKGDTKVVKSPFIEGNIAIAQLELWQDNGFIGKKMQEISRASVNSGTPHWLLTVISIKEGHNYLYTTSEELKQFLREKFGATFEGDRGTTKTLMLRKEILRELKA